MVTMTVKLPIKVALPDGSEAEDAVIRMLTVRERNELVAKYKGDPSRLVLHNVHKRLVRLGDLENPPLEVVEELPTRVFDYLVDATLALEEGYEDVESFRQSRRNQGLEEI